MIHRYRFIILFLVLTGGLGAISRVPEGELPPSLESKNKLQSPVALQAQRQELLEGLERVIAYQHYYRSVYGHFTRIIGKIGLTLHAGLHDAYDIRVLEASNDRIVVAGVSEIDGRIADRVTIDQDYAVKANFELPMPREEYLRIQATRHLRLLKAGSSEAPPRFQGIYRDYFSFDGETALGLRAPVEGVRIELTEDFGSAGIPSPGTELGARIGEHPRGVLMNTLEEAYLAQKIFHGEIGRYARDWSELSKIADFRFQDSERLGPTALPFGIGEAGSSEEASGRVPARSPDPSGAEIIREKGSSPVSDELVIEPITIN